ncbi:MAG: AAA family ATPase [Deltaproteobacteria bacterium]|nr:AAA family ATPase [Deltaproteobacteria bacterium]
MTALTKNLQQVWEQLRSQKAARPDFLDQVRIQRLRGITDLRVTFPFPVCVLAGANGCGKSTVLFALASAYRGPTVAETFTPAKLFPDFRPKTDAALGDQPEAAELEFSYTVGGQSLLMAWKRGKSKWNRSFFGRKRGTQPIRSVYLHTLAKLTNPSELRSVIQLAQRKFESNEIDASNIAFAQRILGLHYAHLMVARDRRRDLLVAERADTADAPVRYSEFHMSAGERAVIRLSVRLSKQTDALVLVDEVEAGLHPLVQQMLMLELQRLALRNHLQIICTTHSPAVLDTVPMEARVFLERVSTNVVRREAYRDVIQKALYGRSQNALSFLCEDEESEAFIRGLLDHLGPKLDLLQNDIEVGRNTGKDQYPAHLETLARFRKLADVVFVVDGDGEPVQKQLEHRGTELGQPVRVLRLPGGQPPEPWAWGVLQRESDQLAGWFGLDGAALRTKLKTLDDLYSNAADKPTAIAKNKLHSLAEETSRATAEFFRYLAKHEAEHQAGEVFELVNRLEDLVRDWRTSRG